MFETLSDLLCGRPSEGVLRVRVVPGLCEKRTACASKFHAAHLPQACPDAADNILTFALHHMRHGVVVTRAAAAAAAAVGHRASSYLSPPFHRNFLLSRVQKHRTHAPTHARTHTSPRVRGSSKPRSQAGYSHKDHVERGGMDEAGGAGKLAVGRKKHRKGKPR